MFGFVALYRPASTELVAGACLTAVVITPLLVGLGLMEGRRHTFDRRRRMTVEADLR